MMDNDQILREHLLYVLDGKGAHMDFNYAVANFPMHLINTRPPNVEYTPWHLVEHLRITQWDILDYMRNPDYTYMEWPKGYWPAPDAEADTATWENSIKQFLTDLEAVKDIVKDTNTNLYAPIPHGEHGHTILREVILVADHNAYHIGELGILRQVMGAW